MLKLLHRLAPGSPSWYRRNRHRRYLTSAVCGAKKRAEQKGLAFDITVEYLLLLGDVCELSGIPFRYPDDGVVSAYSPSLDRKNPAKGYIRGNVRLVLHCLNAMKGRETDEVIIGVMIAVLEKRLLERGTIDA